MMILRFAFYNAILTTFHCTLAKHTEHPASPANKGDSTSAAGACPFPQFELFGSSTGQKTPFADACVTAFTVHNGSCAGTTVWMKALGIYTHVIDVRSPSPSGSTATAWPCTGEDLFKAVLQAPTVKIPSAYFGLGGGPGRCVEFPAAMPTFHRFEEGMVEDLNKVQAACLPSIKKDRTTAKGERSQRKTKNREGSGDGGHEIRGGGGKDQTRRLDTAKSAVLPPLPFLPRSGTLVHANGDLDNLNLWHSLAQLHTLWAASQTLSGSGRPLGGAVDVSSGKCHCEEEAGKGPRGGGLGGARSRHREAARETRRTLTRATLTARQVVAKALQLRGATELLASNSLSHARDLLLAHRHRLILRVPMGAPPPPLPTAYLLSAESHDGSKMVFARLKAAAAAAAATRQRNQNMAAPDSPASSPPSSSSRPNLTDLLQAATKCAELLKGALGLVSGLLEKEATNPDQNQRRRQVVEKALDVTALVSTQLGDLEDERNKHQEGRGNVEQELEQEANAPRGGGKKQTSAYWLREVSSLASIAASATNVSRLLTSAVSASLAPPSSDTATAALLLLVLNTVSLAAEATERAVRSVQVVASDVASPLEACLENAKGQVQVAVGLKLKLKLAARGGAGKRGGEGFAGGGGTSQVDALKATAHARAAAAAVEGVAQFSSATVACAAHSLTKWTKTPPSLALPSPSTLPWSSRDAETLAAVPVSLVDFLVDVSGSNRTTTATAAAGTPYSFRGHRNKGKNDLSILQQSLPPSLSPTLLSSPLEVMLASVALVWEGWSAREAMLQGAEEEGHLCSCSVGTLAADSILSPSARFALPSSAGPPTPSSFHANSNNNNGGEGDSSSSGGGGGSEDPQQKTKTTATNTPPVPVPSPSRDSLRVLREYNRSHCYSRHVFVVRHRKRGPVNPGGWPEPEEPSFPFTPSSSFPSSFFAHLSSSSAAASSAPVMVHRPALQAMLKQAALKKRKECQAEVSTLEANRKEQKKKKAQQTRTLSSKQYRLLLGADGGRSSSSSSSMNSRGSIGGSSSSSSRGSIGGSDSGEGGSGDGDSGDRGSGRDGARRRNSSGGRGGKDGNSNGNSNSSSSNGYEYGEQLTGEDSLSKGCEVVHREWVRKNGLRVHAEEGAPALPPLVERSACGNSQGGYWNFISGLLWDAKLCGADFKCDSPPAFRVFVADVKAAMARRLLERRRERGGSGSRHREKTRVEEKEEGKDEEGVDSGVGGGVTNGGGGEGLVGVRRISDRSQQGRTLCYMSRGVGLQRGGMEDEKAVRDYVLHNGKRKAKNEEMTIQNKEEGTYERGGERTSRQVERSRQRVLKNKKEKQKWEEGKGQDAQLSPPVAPTTHHQSIQGHGCARALVLDFTQVSVEHYKNFTRQASLVESQCDVLIGPHGAGMGHLIWMTPPPTPQDYGDDDNHDHGNENGNSKSNGRVVVEFIGVDEKSKTVTQPWYYKHLSALAGLRYLVFSEFLPSTMPPGWEDPEDLGLTPTPDFDRLSAFLQPLCQPS